jgi:hypothetical protein
MKKTFLVLTIMLTATVTFGQNKWQEKQINHFVEVTAKEYGLDAAKKAELLEARKSLVLGYNELNQKDKAGEITKEEKQELTKEGNRNFHMAITKLTGKSYKELEPFLEKMREELKNLK